MPWLYIILSCVAGIITGFAVFSRGSIFAQAVGVGIQGVLSLGCFGLIGWAFWEFGFWVGLLELFVVFCGTSIGQRIVSPRR